MKVRTLVPLLLSIAASVALAKLPALSPDAQAKADEAKAKTAWTDKVAAFQLCRSMDKVADRYLKSVKASSASAPTPQPTPPCTDPGPYVPVASASAPPLEAAGAHSPAATAAAPHNTNTPQAQQQGTKK
jgi:hypothetical protein